MLFSCRAGWWYRTWELLWSRVFISFEAFRLTLIKKNRQNVPKSIRYGTSPKRDLQFANANITQIRSLTHDSATGLHLLRNPTCAQHYNDSMFSILAKGRSPFHLSALEATFIKTSNPKLCRQKEFVYNLKIFACFRWVVNLLRTVSLSRPLVLCQSQLGSFYKYSAFSVLSILTILLDKCQTKSFEVVEWSARLARKRVFRVRRLLAPSSMMHILL